MSTRPPREYLRACRFDASQRCRAAPALASATAKTERARRLRVQACQLDCKSRGASPTLTWSRVRGYMAPWQDACTHACAYLRATLQHGRMLPTLQGASGMQHVEMHRHVAFNSGRCAVRAQRLVLRAPSELSRALHQRKRQPRPLR
jgi:hypothetical protein